MSKTNPIDPNVPAGSEDPKLGDNRIRALAAAVVEALDVDHYMGTDGGSGTGYNSDEAGEHAKITLRTGSAPSVESDKGYVYVKDVDGKAELFYKDEDSNEIQITSAGSIKKSVIQNSAFAPSGVVLPYVGSSAPTGWLLCNGSAVSRTTYADLFAVIGTTYGSGDGSTTFNLPDLRGRVPVGEDSAGSRLSSNNLRGNESGAETHTLTTSQIPAHHHTMNRDTDAFYGGERSGVNNSGSGAWTTGDTGGGGSHNNMQPYQIFNYIIKT